MWIEKIAGINYETVEGKRLQLWNALPSCRKCFYSFVLVCCTALMFTKENSTGAGSKACSLAAKSKVHRLSFDFCFHSYSPSPSLNHFLSFLQHMSSSFRSFLKVFLLPLLLLSLDLWFFFFVLQWFPITYCSMISHNYLFSFVSPSHTHSFPPHI